MIITGLRGVGKTVLLNEFVDIAKTAGWQVIEFEASKRDDNHFRQAMFSQLKAALLRLSPRARWTDRGRRAAEVLTAFAMSIDSSGTFSVSWDIPAAEGLADHHDLGMDLTDALLAIGEAAQEQEHGVALLIDEVQFLKSYAERLFRFPRIGSLDGDDARKAITEPALSEGVTYSHGAVDAAIRITKGYPYFIQELGYQVWEVALGVEITADDVEIAREAYEAKLDTSFFRVRLDRATPLQTAYMRAMAELGPEPQKASDVARVMKRDSTQLGPTRAELIDMGLLYTPDHGYAAFTVPDFDMFMLRAVPELVIPEVRRRGENSN